ncbi:MAG: glycosyltransferase family 4 protein [Chlorobiaceae bacterium]|nr:glycosyltransferase family 4 protein [Chlorobiaceae bacterium]
MRKALFLTRQFPPFVTSGASRAWKFALNLPPFGWEPIVVAPPEIAGLEEARPASLPMPPVSRTGPAIDLGGLGAWEREAVLLGRGLHTLKPLAARLSSLFSDDPEGAAWQRGAAAEVERLLSEHSDIEMLYAQGPPLQPLMLALDIARRRHLTVLLDIASPLDPAMPPPGTRGQSAAAKAEERVLLSGLPMIVPSRALKEYFLKKYQGRLSNGLMTIVPPGYDAAHPSFGASSAAPSSSIMRWVFHVGALSKRDLKAFTAGVVAFAKNEGLGPDNAQLHFMGEGAQEVFRWSAKSALAPMIAMEPGSGMLQELECCRKADIFCTVLGSAPVDAFIVPDRMIDALGMRRPLCCVAPSGVLERLVLDAGGLVAPCGEVGLMAAMMGNMAAQWRSRTLRGAPDELLRKYAVGSVLHEMVGAIKLQYV